MFTQRLCHSETKFTAVGAKGNAVKNLSFGLGMRHLQDPFFSPSGQRSKGSRCSG